PSAIFLDDHVGNLINSFVSRETPAAFEAFPATADQIARAPFARIDHLIVAKRAERAFQPALPPLAWSPLERLPRTRVKETCFPSCSAAFSARARLRSSPMDNPSWINKGTPTNVGDANVISHKTI